MKKQHRPIVPRSQDETITVHFHHTTKTLTDNKDQYSATEIKQEKRYKKKYKPTPPITAAHEKEIYPSRYNRAVWSYNHVSLNKHKKKNMFNLGFLMHYITFIVALCIVWIAIHFSLWIQYLMILSIIVSVLYFLSSLYNLVIFLVNGSVADDPHLIYDSHFRQFGERRNIDEVELRGEWVAVDGDQTIYDNDFIPHLDAINDLQEKHNNTGRFEMLFYSFRYLEKFVHFPDAIAFQGIIAFITFLVAIAVPVLFQCSWGKNPAKNDQICYLARG